MRWSNSNWQNNEQRRSAELEARLKNEKLRNDKNEQQIQRLQRTVEKLVEIKTLQDALVGDKN